jgi:hypothetical protein
MTRRSHPRRGPWTPPAIQGTVGRRLKPDPPGSIGGFKTPQAYAFTVSAPSHLLTESARKKPTDPAAPLAVAPVVNPHEENEHLGMVPALPSREIFATFEEARDEAQSRGRGWYAAQPLYGPGWVVRRLGA